VDNVEKLFPNVEPAKTPEEYRARMLDGLDDLSREELLSLAKGSIDAEARLLGMIDTLQADVRKASALVKRANAIADRANANANAVDGPDLRSLLEIAARGLNEAKLHADLGMPETAAQSVASVRSLLNTGLRIDAAIGGVAGLMHGWTKQ
jgi:hypothetical protein